MNQNELIQFYKDLYFSEIARKEKITDRAQVLFGFIATGLTLLAYMIKAIDINALTASSITLIIFCSASLFSIIYSTYLLKNVFWGNTYEYISKPDEIERYRNELIQHQSILKSIQTQPFLKISTFEQFIIDDLVASSGHNVNTNEERISKMNRFYKSNILSISLVFLSGCIFVMGNLNNIKEQETTLSHIQGSFKIKETKVKINE